MRMSVRLRLPREVDSVPAVRRLLRCALSILHVDRQASDDLEIALTEACANVVHHASGTDKYEVHLNVGQDMCAIDVVDGGAGFDATGLETTGKDAAAPPTDHDRGRGLFLIRALSDSVRMDSRPRHGCLIHFEKHFGMQRGQSASAVC